MSYFGKVLCHFQVVLVPTGHLVVKPYGRKMLAR